MLIIVSIKALPAESNRGQPPTQVRAGDSSAAVQTHALEQLSAWLTEYRSFKASQQQDSVRSRICRMLIIAHH